MKKINHEKLEKAIIVWPFDDAPERYRAMSTNGGDEDWIAFVPSAMAEDLILWMMEGGPFGCYKIEEYKVEGGVIRIGCHA